MEAAEQGSGDQLTDGSIGKCRAEIFHVCSIPAVNDNSDYIARHIEYGDCSSIY
jgi:hypothetical protein